MAIKAKLDNENGLRYNRYSLEKLILFSIKEYK